ncbi:MAG TPA: hypothetical protein VF902_00790 [Coriobacteriia bacterium]
MAEVLRAYACELAAEGAAQVGGSFSDVPGADEMLRSRPEAFLIGILFTQGVPAQRAWAGPFLLAERLGHFDLARLASDRDAVDEAVCRRPALHRFKHTIAGWVSDAASRLLDCYGGDASLIWAPGSSAAQVSERLSAFSGIGRKKAAMAVEILNRHFGVALSGMDEGTVAYDVHVRRVFLRSGLVDADTPRAVAGAARAAWPEAPGSADLAVWLVGRQWCRPREPRCGECRLRAVCERRVWLDVQGVGVRTRGR